MRLSLWPHAHQPWSEILAVAQLAEGSGGAGVWFGDSRPPALECWTVLAGLAATVPRARLGAFVADDCGRHPAVVVKLAATVDHLSGGRLVLGLVAARDDDGPARLAEACEVVTRLQTHAPATWTGRFYQLHGAPLDPKPLQRPLPLLLCGPRDAAGADGGPARLAARYATQYHLSGSPRQVRDQVAALHRGCHEIGRDPGEVAVSVRTGGPTGAAAYAEAGVDELIVGDDAFGQGPDKLAALVAVMSDLTAALG